jgi:hypothetical protein
MIYNCGDDGDDDDDDEEEEEEEEEEERMIIVMMVIISIIPIMIMEVCFITSLRSQRGSTLSRMMCCRLYNKQGAKELKCDESLHAPTYFGLIT